MSPQPFSTSQYDDKHEPEPVEEPLTGKPVMHLPWHTWLLAFTLSALIILAGFVAISHARPRQGPAPTHHVGAAPAALRARAACPDTATPTQCRAALRRALKALAWQKKNKRYEVARVLENARGRQPYAYAARLAEMACRSFSATPTRCRPASEMLAVGRCESGLQNHDPNPYSTADGWMQFLSGTWYSSTAGQLGYSRFDAIAMGIATEATVHRDGSWREWTCGWAVP